jgi:hypothetical protein
MVLLIASSNALIRILIGSIALSLEAMAGVAQMPRESSVKRIQLMMSIAVMELCSPNKQNIPFVLGKLRLAVHQGLL